MTKRELAAQLRARSLASGALEKVFPAGTDFEALLSKQSDDMMIDSYVRCSGCKELFLPLEKALRIMDGSHSADQWLARIADVTQHRHRN
jgi:hypothetical protein